MRGSGGAETSISYVMFLLLLAPFGRTPPPKLERTGSDPSRRLKSCSWSGEGGRIDSGHPDACLVDFEEIGHKRIEINVGIRKVVKGELLPVPRCSVE